MLINIIFMELDIAGAIVHSTLGRRILAAI